jgi:hypothetical protein
MLPALLVSYLLEPPLELSPLVSLNFFTEKPSFHFMYSFLLIGWENKAGCSKQVLLIYLSSS